MSLYAPSGDGGEEFRLWAAGAATRPLFLFRQTQAVSLVAFDIPQNSRVTFDATLNLVNVRFPVDVVANESNDSLKMICGRAILGKMPCFEGKDELQCGCKEH